MNNESTTIQEYKDLRGNPFSLKGKITGQTPNNFTISKIDITTLRDTTWVKKKPLFFFLLTTLFLTVYLSQFSLAIYIFLFSFACFHSRSSPKLHCPQSHTLGLFFTFLLLLHQRYVWDPFISLKLKTFCWKYYR